MSAPNQKAVEAAREATRNLGGAQPRSWLEPIIEAAEPHIRADERERVRELLLSDQIVTQVGRANAVDERLFDRDPESWKKVALGFLSVALDTAFPRGNNERS
jgi:hypothetical protein